MTQIVEVVHEGSNLIGKYEFPDNATDKEIEDALNQLIKPKEPPPQQKGPSMFEAMLLAAERSEGQAQAVGRFGVGMAYLNGTDGVKKSKAAAKLYLKKAADAHFTPAQEVLKTLD